MELREPHIVQAGEGEIVDLGVAKMRLLATGHTSAEGFSLAEFTGGEGPWTVPHVHNNAEEAFLVLEGRFVFTVDGKDIEVSPGGFLNVPQRTPHVFSGQPGGGRLLVLWVPGGLEGMFLELGRLPAGSIRDPKVRAEISSRYDSVPISPPS
jgi:mannose-6-phosphate isomerase-like protein (cupin superfamily)